MERGEITIAAPPDLPRPTRADAVVRLLPVLLAAGMLAVLALGYRTGSAGARNPVFLALMLVSTAAGALMRGGRPDVDADRDGYLGYLATLRDEVTGIAAAQRDSLHRDHPEPTVLWTLVGTPALWCRRPGDPRFGRVRVGLGTVPLAARLVAPPREWAHRVDPVTDGALRCFLDTHAVLADAPVTLDLLGRPALVLGGDPGGARGLARAVLCQLAVTHGPDLVQITAVTGEHTRQYWDWLKWLPHRRDSGGAGRRVVIVVDGVAAPEPEPGCSVIEIGGSATEVAELPDRLELIDTLTLARRLAGHHPAGSGERDWPALLGLRVPDRFDPQQVWAGLDPGQRLRVPIGTDDTGRPVHLDLNEAAAGGSGPHGLCIGATGSGKSELLRTLVLGLLASHSPEQLNLVLIDFKGGATFLGMQCANHVAAVITNLAEEAPLVDRARETLAGELHRRQELLRAAGNFAGVADYNVAVRAGAPLEPLPTLLIVVDEFTELLSAHPDFIDTFVAIGRLGRSLGIHLLLASQRLEEGRLRGLESHLSYRVCLKTLSAAESRLVIGVPDAHQLPNTPGVGYLRTADGELTGFRTAYVSGPMAPAGTVRLFTGAPTAPPAAGRPLLPAVLEVLAGHGPPARRIWLPPLTESPPLHTLTDSGLPELVVPIGVVDRPFEQRRTPLLADLRGAAGHVAVVGAPQSGKSTALATLITALAARHGPDRVQVYGLDFGGGPLAALAALPHVGSVAQRSEPELVRRIVADLETIIERREADRPGTERPDVFLVIDGWAGLCRDFDTLEAPILALAGRGLSHRLHLVIAAARWAEIRPALRDLLGTRIELRLGEPADSEIDRRRAAQVPYGRPGSGLAADGRHLLVARPHTAIPDYGDRAAPPVRLLPAIVHRQTLAAAAPDRPVLGIEDREFAPVTLDFTRQPHLLILGDTECGKTSTLRTLCRELTRIATPEQARLIVVDYRRGLLGEVDGAHLAGYAATPAALTAAVTELAGIMARRLPGPDVTPTQLKERSWYAGPRYYLLVDDCDLLTGDPLAPLAGYLPHAGDIGVHLVVARRSAGAARALYDPLLAGLREHGCMSLVMSAGADEGPLLAGVRPSPLPPGRGILITRAGGQQLIQVAWSR